MSLSSSLIAYCGLTAQQIFKATPPLVVLSADTQNNVAIKVWNVPNVAEPTTAQIQSWMSAGPTVNDLRAYAAKAQAKVLAAGETFNVAASGATAINILCDGEQSTRADLALLALYGQANPTGSKTWIDNNGVATVLSGSELVTLATLAGNWITDTYASLTQIIAQITATTPTITTTAQIDGYQWPTS